MTGRRRRKWSYCGLIGGQRGAAVMLRAQLGTRPLRASESERERESRVHVGEEVKSENSVA